MRKSQTIPKICVTAVFLIIALIISVPVFSVAFNKLLGGGTLEFGTAGSVEFRENRPIEGSLYYIIGCTSGDEGESDFTLKNGSYYYLVTVKGKTLSSEGTDEVLLIKTLSNSESYENLNTLWRTSGDGSSENSYPLSGVIKKGEPGDKKIVEKICDSGNIENVKYVEYNIDCTNPVSSYVNRFLISLIFYAGFVVSLLLVIQSINRNRSIDDIEHQRAITQAIQDVKSGKNSPDEPDAMFGDTDRSFAAQDTQYQGQSQSGQQFQSNQQAQGGQQFQNSQQSQGGQQFQNSQQSQGGQQFQSNPQSQSGYQFQNSQQSQGGQQFQNSQQSQGGYQFQNSQQFQGGQQFQNGQQFQSGQRNTSDDEYDGFFGS